MAWNYESVGSANRGIFVAPNGALGWIGRSYRVCYRFGAGFCDYEMVLLQGSETGLTQAQCQIQAFSLSFSTSRVDSRQLNSAHLAPQFQACVWHGITKALVCNCRAPCSNWCFIAALLPPGPASRCAAVLVLGIGGRILRI